MPLIEGKSQKSFQKNVRTEMHHGKPMGQALAIAYSMKKKAKHKAHGGEMCAHGKYMCDEPHDEMMAEGGEMSPFDPKSKDKYTDYSHEMLNPVSAVVKHKGKWIDTVGPSPMEIQKAIKKHKQTHPGAFADGGFVEEEKASGFEPNPEENPEHHYDHAVENQGFPMEEEDMVSRIMKQRFSKGGQVANETHVTADFEPNEFDELAKDDSDMEGADYTGANSGDEIGDEQEDEDRHDMVARIMRSRRMRSRMPKAGVDLHA